MTLCTACKGTIAREEKSNISCITCKQIFHLKCLNIESDAQKKRWICHICELANKNKPHTPVKKVDSLEDSITKILSKVENLTEDFKEVKSTLQKQVDLSFENTERLKSLEELVLKQERLIENLTAENSSLKKKVKNLEIRVNQTEQDRLSNTIEIRGVPARAGETPEGTVLKIGASLGIRLNIEDLDYVQKRRW